MQRIEIHDGDLNNTSLCDVIERIAERNASARRIPGTLLALRNLTEISIVALEDLMGLALASEVIQACLRLPSVRILRGTGLGPAYPMTLQRVPPNSSNVTELDFHQCAISIAALQQLLAHLKCVKKFAYNHDVLLEHFGSSGERDYSCNVFIATLAKHTAKTLQELEYSMFRSGCVKNNRCQEAAVSLNSFKALERIRVVSAFFVCDPHRGRRVAHRLVDCLPHSIKSLELSGSIAVGDNLIHIRRVDDEGVTNCDHLMFAGLAELKDERLPKLNKVVFENSE